MTRKVGFGIIGAGMIAAFHAEALKTLDNAELIGFYDSNPEFARKRAEQYGCRAYDSFAKFLADPTIQAVTIATPSGAHSAVAIPAARAGKHILCEKPLEVSLEKTDAIIQACEENHVLLVPVFQTRFSRPVQLVLQAMKQGRFGRMLLASAQMHWYRDEDYYARSSWRGTWAMDGGGALMNQAIHTVDQLICINGEPESVFAYAGTMTHQIEVEDNLCAAIKYKNGSFGTIEVSTSCKPGFPRRLEFSGTNGTAAFEEDHVTRWEFAEPMPGDEDIRAGLQRTGNAAGGRNPTNIAVDGHKIQLHDLAEAILTGRRPMLNGAEGRKAVAMITGIYQSVQTGKAFVF